MKSSISVGLAALILSGSSALANPPLKENTVVTEGIIATGIAYEISERCGSISPRLIRGLNYLRSLEQHALDQGYSQAEVDAFTGSDTEKRRLEAIARARLADMGAVVGNEASYCAVGEAEMAAGTAVGRLLR